MGSHQFIDETSQKLKKADFLQKFEGFWKGRKETAAQLAKSTANGDESLEKGTLAVLEETLKKDPQLVEVDDSYIKAYHNANQEANELKNKLDNAEQDVKQKDTEIEALKKQLESSKTETSDKQKALDQNKAEVAAWQKQKSDADQLIGQQKQQIGDLTSQSAVSCKEVDRLNQELKKALATNHENELKNKDLENKLNIEKVNYEHDNDTNNAKIEKLIAQIKTLEDQLSDQKEEFEKLLVEEQQKCLAFLDQEKNSAYNRGKVDQQAETQNLVQQLQAMIMSAQQPAILAPQTQAQDQANNADSQGSNTTDGRK